MSFSSAINISNLSKAYQMYDNPSDRLKQFFVPRVERVLGIPQRKFFREFWALKDVSFEVKKGESLGIIGRNGSGKSTLLQLICGTLNPTSGSITTNGRIAALLELGSGFNPEFTGRENVYLNASVLGLSKAQIDDRFDSIAAFADIGQFIDQAVKTYSSGMYVRLAFAVIAHVDADILVVDEALSVGDAVFTQKCLRFVRQFQETGTLLFVSHDVASVQNLCNSCLWLKDGQVAALGAAKGVAHSYFQYTMQQIYGDEAKLEATYSSLERESLESVEKDLGPLETAVDYSSKLTVLDNVGEASGWRTGDAEILSLHMTNLSNPDSSAFLGGEKVRMSIRASTKIPLEKPIIGFLVRDRLGQDLFGENTLQCTHSEPVQISGGSTFDGVFEFRLPMLPNIIGCMMH
jgi:lipopolysaccharide transport system ATP-binding protein